MSRLENGYGLYYKPGVRIPDTDSCHNQHIVRAKFKGTVQIVFEGISHKECVKYCHEHGMKLIDEDRWHSLANPWFRKINAKNPVDVSKVFIGRV